MSACLIITQGNNMFIGADSACSVKTDTGFKRCFDDAQKLFCVGEQVIFCSGNMNNAYKCVDWIKNQFTDFICVEKLNKYLVENYSDLQDEYYSIEILIADYSNNTVYQLSQYNNFNIITYPYSEHIRIICGGYKTSENFQLAKENIQMKKSINNVYFDTYNSIVDECLGGYLYLYSSPNSFSKIRLLEKNIKYISASNCHLLTSEFVTSGHIYGSQIIGGDIYSENYSETSGTYINLKDGTFSFGGGALTFDGEMLKISSPDLDEHVTSITKDTITTEYVNALNVTAGTVAAENISGEVIFGKTIEAGNIVGGSIVGTSISNGNGTFSVDENGSVKASDITITGGKIGEFKLYYSKISGSYYLETLPTDDVPLTTGIGNNQEWAFWTGYDYSTNKATFWVTNNGEVHMRNWLYGSGYDSWALWTKTDNYHRYGLEYIFGDYDPVSQTMNLKFVFYDHGNGTRFHYILPLTNKIMGES